MNNRELKEECSSGKWLPVLVIRTEKDGSPIIPLFDSVQVAARFAKRNLPKGWLCGTVNMRLKDAQWMDQKGWRAIKFDYPRKLVDIVGFDVEILEFEPEHTLVIKA